jgi:protein ImuB
MNASSSRRRYLSVWLRRLATDRLTRRRSSAPAEKAPLVVAEEVKSALRLAAVNDAAAGLGLKPGMALADTRAMYPTITVVEADPEADRNLLEAIADWCDRYTPLVGLDPPELFDGAGLMFDITGCAHLFGGEAALCGDIVRRLAALGFHARVAVADTVGCAWAVTRYGASAPPPERGRSASAASRVGVRACRKTEPPPDRFAVVLPLSGGGKEIVPVDGARNALLSLPLAALRIASDIVADLAQVGLKRIADVIDRPRAPLAARFGVDFVRRLDQALGRDDEPITPRLPIPPYVAERRFAEPIALEADVIATIEHLAQELGRMLERRGEGARGLQAALFRTDGKVHRIAVGTGTPLRDGARIRALFAERLAAIGDACDPGFGFDVIRLCAFASERCDPAQTGLAGPDEGVELSHLIDRLGARFGLRRITRLMPQDTHIPEFAVMTVAAALYHPEVPAEGRPRRIYDPIRGPSRLAAPAPQDDGGVIAEQDSLAPIRPIRLFEKPERIEATAEVPDGPPMQFTWRHVRHLVVHAEGPERIALEWWRDAQGHALTRDYFRVESREGVRVWLYREGFFGAGTKPNWFLHGVFA